MGYTHYWENPKAIPTETWALICDDAQKLIAASPVSIQWESDDKRPPEVSRLIEPLIRFNGVDGDGHETFYVEACVIGFAFCKTARKPYDIMVTAMLAMIHAHWSSFKVSSDGNAHEWEDGLAFASKTLGREITIDLKAD